jgi:DNA-directed RNA polymerase specialized sigma24 family protein
MGVETTATSTAFAEFMQRTEPRLRRALVATYGPIVGRDAAVDALSWAWEHWDRLEPMANPVGYLYRVGQTSARRHRTELRPAQPTPLPAPTDPVPELAPALMRLSEQQRAAVVLVHGYAMSLREAADTLGIAVSTLREHLERGMTRLRHELEDGDEH